MTEIDSSIAIVDAHHHLWDLSALHYPWSKVPPHDMAVATFVVFVDALPKSTVGKILRRELRTVV